MNQKLKNRIAACKSRLADGNAKLKSTARSINNEIESFGQFKIQVLQNTVGRFKELADSLNMKLKGSEYDIPQSMVSPTSFICQFNKVEFNPLQIKRIGDGAAAFIQNAGNIILQSIAANRGKTFKPIPSVNNRGANNNWWIGLVVALCNIAGAYAEKKSAEYTEVERFEAETEKQLKKIDAHIAFCNQISRRLKELTMASEGLNNRTSEQLDNLEKILNIFDTKNIQHVNTYQKVTVLVKGCSELAKVEILDSNHKLSEKDKQYIIKCKKLSITEI